MRCFCPAKTARTGFQDKDKRFASLPERNPGCLKISQTIAATFKKKSAIFPSFYEKAMTTLKTRRLILRPWKETDLKPFAELNANPRVMQYFPSVLSRKESDDLARCIIAKFEQQTWGVWAVSLPDVADLIGFIGLNKPDFDAHFTPTVEVAWRLAFNYWGKGYATEGAQAALQYGFDHLKLDGIVSFTTLENIRSRHVMEKIGMDHDRKDDFDHPKLPEGHPLKRHVLYRIKQSKWRVDHAKSKQWN